MSKKILLIGASGLLGGELQHMLQGADVTLLLPSHSELDIAEYDSVASYLTQTEPDVVINTAAKINVDALEEDPEPGWAVNAVGAGNVARALAQEQLRGSRLIHMSTNYIFGDVKDSYDELDVPSPINAYGASKAVGESLVMQYCLQGQVPYNIIRTSWLYSLHRETFIDAVAQHLLRGESVDMLRDQYGNLTNAADLASALVDDFVMASQESGIYHLVNHIAEDRKGVSRYDVGLSIAHALDVSESLIRPRLSENFFKAKRPKAAVLHNTKFRPLPLWEESLHAYIAEKYGHSDHVSHKQ